MSNQDQDTWEVTPSPIDGMVDKLIVEQSDEIDHLRATVATLEREEPFFMAPVKMKRELDETFFKRLYKDQPGVYARLAKGVTATPGKTGVTVSRTE